MEQLHITVLGQPQLTAKLNAVVARLGGLEREFTLIGEALTKFYSAEPFLSRGGVYGEQWADLSPNYKKIKERKYPGKGTLVASGKMRDSFSFAPEPMRVTIMNKSPLFPYHQQGTDKMPQRVMMELDRTRVNLLMGIAKKSLNTRISEAWE